MARKMTEWPSKRGPITKIMPSDGCIGGYSSLGGGKVVRFPRIWMVYGECRIRQPASPGHCSDTSVSTDRRPPDQLESGYKLARVTTI